MSVSAIAKSRLLKYSLQVVSNTFCPNPFMHIELYSDGRFRPCCKAIMQSGDMSAANTKDYWNAQEMLEIRKKMLEGKRPNECRRCWEQEDLGGYSYRMHTLEKERELNWAKESTVDKASGYSKTRPRHVMITLNNRCNLQCRMCNGVFSSKWETAYNTSDKMQQWFASTSADAPEEFNIKDYKRDENLFVHTEDVVDFFEGGVSDVRKLSILGGEPFIQDEHLEILQKCAGHEHNIDLVYNSNLSIPHERLQLLLDAWKNFRTITIGVSIDGPPGLNEYIRHGTKVNLIEKNILSLSSWSKENSGKLRMFTTCTFSAYNMKFIPETIKYTTGLGLMFSGNLAETPFFLKPQVLSREEKIEITEKVQVFLKNLEEELQEGFLTKELWMIPYKKEEQLKNVRQFVNSALVTMNSSDESFNSSYFVSFNEMFDEGFRPR